ncbi:ubiquinone/menaquinone biosynthesis methylase [Sporocytophaga myxococcoides]|uniref:Ubiquinone/menaquinone biosynthesis methylase n=1 Tax=Sporocytophaga myxococcoides TaxID=153721 RepID=A0A098LAC9_9BACT|nr:class I SAM-dependent methyltransferase [Sporocytophaga myxococcoides]GAL83382.1 ubiquinone/menaquinone biosynthesis methylase [Sporocytophaga myxococcoides]
MERQRKGFNRLAAIYDYLLLIPPGRGFIKSQEELIHLLPEKKSCLIIGGGTGNFLRSLIISGKVTNIVNLDISEKMLAKASVKIKDLYQDCKVEFRRGSFDKIAEEEKFDLIITNFFLDLFSQEEVKTWISFIHEKLSSEGLFYYTDLQISRGKTLRTFMKNMYIKVLYFFFRNTTSISGKTLIDLRTEILQSGFNIIHEKGYLKELFYSAIFKKRS